jgi:hypothetical protein
MRKTLGQSGSQVLYETQEIAVPACLSCKERQEGAERGMAGFLLCVMVAPIIAGAVWGGWEGAFLGLGVGFFGSLVLKAMLDGRGRAAQHPKVQALVKSGWDFL